ncbi:MAG TPA: hypothetical protein VNZ03_08760 [Terriglobales bacterium]|nr:hypothetical protein [Terriglobales bacterium]
MTEPQMFSKEASANAVGGLEAMKVPADGVPTDPVPKSSVRFRQVRFDDYRQISELQARYGMETETSEAWIHLWADNPACQSLPNWPIGWLLENEDNRVVGYIGNLPRCYQLGSRNVIVTSTRGLVVDERYRSYSVPLLSLFFNQKQVDLFLDTTVGPGALKAHEIFRARRVPAGIWDQAFFWITNYKGFSASLLARKEMREAKGLLHYPLSAGLFLRDTLEGRTLRIRRNGLEPSFCTKLDERFEDFWQTLRKSSPDRLLANRSQPMLDWHFKHALADGRAWVMTLSEGSKLSAYAVFLRQDNPLFSLKRVRLVDFQALNGQTELLRPLLCHAFERCRREGIHMLEAMGFAPEKQRVIDSLLPHKRVLSSWRYFYKTANPELAEILKNPEVWDPSCFDGDASL